MTHELRLFFIALQFFTRLPVPRWVGFEPAWLNASARYFPLVGTCVGAAAAIVLWAASWLFPPVVAVGFSMAATVLLTGAFHEDGLADTCDALGGAVSRERALEIMKDSRIGSYGAVALVLMLGLKAAALAALPLALALPALLLGHTASRAAAVSLIRWLPYAGDVAQAKAKPLAERISTVGWAVACGWVAALAMALLLWQRAWWPAVGLGLLLTVVGTLVCARWFQRRLGGITGDALGATQQITELLLCWGGSLPCVGCDVGCGVGNDRAGRVDRLAAPAPAKRDRALHRPHRFAGRPSQSQAARASRAPVRAPRRLASHRLDLAAAALCSRGPMAGAVGLAASGGCAFAGTRLRRVGRAALGPDRR